MPFDIPSQQCENSTQIILNTISFSGSSVRHHGKENKTKTKVLFLSLDCIEYLPPLTIEGPAVFSKGIIEESLGVRALVVYPPFAVRDRPKIGGICLGAWPPIWRDRETVTTVPFAPSVIEMFHV